MLALGLVRIPKKRIILDKKKVQFPLGQICRQPKQKSEETHRKKEEIFAPLVTRLEFYSAVIRAAHAS